MRKLIFIVGPTAVGKSHLAAKVARRIKAKIISCDSMQVYKGMPILSQAPTRAITDAVRHHLIGVISPTKEYNAARFRLDAIRAMRRVLKTVAVPIFVGGSGLYVKALIDGLFPTPKADLKFRGRMQRFISGFGSAALHKKLSLVDPAAAAGVHPNDSRRIIRGLEIYNSTGRTRQELKASTRGLKDEFDIIIIGLTRPRDELYERINTRVDEMIKTGLADEVRGLMKKRLSRTASGILGFKEISGWLRGEYGLTEAVERLKKNTRNFAKAQVTWFRADKRIRWFDMSRMSEREITERIWKKLS